MDNSIYKNMSSRTGGDIYIGVVGPVRTGKSTFIKKFMDTIVIPNIESPHLQERAKDELPQSAAGRTIMTTEPKFIPEDAVNISVEKSVNLRVRMIDCVGYIVPSSLGYIEDEQPRMVMTPWFEKEIPFNMAAEIGTKKVITEHSTIGLVVTTDGSISDIPRDEYEEAEERVINELKELNKPFAVVLNSVYPNSPETVALAKSLQIKYDVPVLAVSCIDLEEKDIKQILMNVLYEFPISDISVNMPLWIKNLEKENWFKDKLFTEIKEKCDCLSSIRTIFDFTKSFDDSEITTGMKIEMIDLSCGSVKLKLSIDNSYFYKILSEKCNTEILDEQQLMSQMIELYSLKNKFNAFNNALEQVEKDGYGIVMPTMEQLKLDEPEIMKQGGRYGVRLKASAPSIHMIKCNTYTEVAPIVGSESQSRELVMYLLKEFEENPGEIWNSNIFGTSLHELVNEGLHNKLYRMPQDARNKFRETIERVINEGCNGLICIIL